MFNSAVIRGEAAKGYSSGEAMTEIENIVREHLPDNIGVEWSGLSYQQKQAGGKTGMVLALVLIFVFLFLAALYESWSVPVAVILLGMAAKNAILIVGFAKRQADQGISALESALYASRLRFRPILMTSLAFILGMLPLVIASGPGSASRQAIGTGVFFGMIFAVIFGVLLVPFFFVIVYRSVEKFLPSKKKKTIQVQ